MVTNNIKYPTICLFFLSIVSCGSSREKKHESQQHDNASTYYQEPVYSVLEEPKEDKDGAAFAMEPQTDKYEDGYQDGEAAAEEDRLAGKPGMQAGDDDDDDDDEYEDGYDDGYDD